MGVFEALNSINKDMIEVDTSHLKTRQDYNHAICVVITEIANRFPDWRFHQILTNCGITSNDDLFYEEGRATLLRILKNDVVSKYFRLKEQEGKVIEFNRRNK